MIVKEYGKDFYSDGGALTLSTAEVTDKSYTDGTHQKTHKDGWTILGDIQEDYYKWVNEFNAVHPKFGRVWGNFEDKVYADSEEGFQDFYKNHRPEAWDYGDI